MRLSPNARTTGPVPWAPPAPSPPCHLIPPPPPLSLSPSFSAFVRVRPAHAGDGRYFVAVPRGSNAARYKRTAAGGELPPPPEALRPGSSAAAAAVSPGAAGAVAYAAFLRALDGGFAGSWEEWAAENRGNKDVTGAAAAHAESARRAPEEAPVARGGSGGLVEVDAAAANAAPSPTGRGTQLARADAPASPTFVGVEHLLSALEGMGVGNARIEVEPGLPGTGVLRPLPFEGDAPDGPPSLELPVIDGSALGWAVEVIKVGVRPAPVRGGGGAGATAPPATIPRGSRAITVRGRPDGPSSSLGGPGSFATYIPGPRPELSAGVVAPPDAPAIGRQWFAWAPLAECGHYRWAVAPARDWVASTPELLTLRDDKGAYRAGTVGTTLVGLGDTWLDPGRVRFPGDEPARHAALDAVGDLALLAAGGGLGLPLGHVITWNADPALRLELVRALAAECEAVEAVEAARAAVGG